MFNSKSKKWMEIVIDLCMSLKQSQNCLCNFKSRSMWKSNRSENFIKTYHCEIWIWLNTGGKFISVMNFMIQWQKKWKRKLIYWHQRTTSRKFKYLNWQTPSVMFQINSTNPSVKVETLRLVLPNKWSRLAELRTKSKNYSKSSTNKIQNLSHYRTLSMKQKIKETRLLSNRFQPKKLQRH